ncbi:MAG: hypothetical protein A2V86_06055 [Deltaproteobacteria bacterium RBG_16_49_23]|nr:MAG: hypothetical protein A2V86_06055 [Deltaproteobacteria bacterium RBG_16_49_23]
MGNKNWTLRMGSLLMIAIILWFGSSAYGGGQGPASDPENGSEKAFHYTAKKLGIPILKAIIRIGNGYSEQGKNLYKIEAQVISLKVPGFMFRMNNRFTSFMEMDPFSPLRYVKEIDQEGLFIERKNYLQTITFDSIHHKAIVEKKEAGEKREVLLPSHTYDPLTMFARYHLKEGLPPDQEIRISIFDGVKCRQMVFQLKKSRIRSKILGEVDAFCLASTTAFSSFGEKEGNIRIWYTVNGKKIPVSLELDLPIGVVRFELDQLKEG